MTSALPPAGWYPHDGGERWWDGYQWTADTQAQAGQILPSLAPPVYQQPVFTPQPSYSPMAVQAYGQSGAMAGTDQRTSGVEVTFAWIFTVLTLGYMLPWAIAATRGKSNSVAIGLLNFFLGWTFIGYIVTFVMACMAHQQSATMIQMVNAPQYNYPPGPRQY